MRGRIRRWIVDAIALFACIVLCVATVVLLVGAF